MFRKAYCFDDVQLVPRYYNGESRKDVDISMSLYRNKIALPIISSNMDTITGPQMAEKITQLGGIAILHRFCSIEENVQMFKDSIAWSFYDGAYPASDVVGVSIGVNEGMDRAEALYDAGARLFCVDVAHGHSKLVRNTIKALLEIADDILIIAGNVCDRSGAEYLAGCGAHVIKCGIGPGSVCETRVKTGHGVPQLTAIMDCCRAGLPVIADGGIRNPGDVVKALAAGASFVMLGGMLAGTDETPGEVVIVDLLTGRKTKTFRGMASKEANEDMFGGLTDWKTSEGILTKVYCRGPVEDVIKDIVGGLRSGLTYSGAFSIEDLQKRAEFIEVTPNGNKEGTAHYEK